MIITITIIKDIRSKDVPAPQHENNQELLTPK